MIVLHSYNYIDKQKMDEKIKNLKKETDIQSSMIKTKEETKIVYYIITK